MNCGKVFQCNTVVPYIIPHPPPQLGKHFKILQNHGEGERGEPFRAGHVFSHGTNPEYLDFSKLFTKMKASKSKSE